jgi:formamidopyrimidine-DNA glycosylase
LEDKNVINYLDLRRFGTFHLVEDFSHYPSLQKLGPDALRDDLPVEELFKKLTKVKKGIYQLLLDQTFIAGLGNIYVNEILHAVQVHPLTPAENVTREKFAEIISEMQRILALALTLKGTTLIDNLYQDPEGKAGEFAKLLKVYGKHKNPKIEVLKIGGRSVFVDKTTKPYISGPSSSTP